MGKKYSFCQQKSEIEITETKNTMVYLPKKKKEKKTPKKIEKRNTKRLTGDMICMSMCVAITKNILCNDTSQNKNKKKISRR